MATLERLDIGVNGLVLLFTAKLLHRHLIPIPAWGGIQRQRVLFFLASLFAFLSQISFLIHHCLVSFVESIQVVRNSLPNVGTVFLFGAFAVLNLSTIDRYERFLLILPHSYTHYKFIFVKVFSLCLGIMAAIGGVLPTNATPVWMNYFIAFFSVWTAGLDCALNMRMILMTLFQEHQESVSPLHSRNNSTMKKSGFLKSSYLMTEECTGSPLMKRNIFLPGTNSTQLLQNTAIALPADPLDIEEPPLIPTQIDKVCHVAAPMAEYCEENQAHPNDITDQPPIVDAECIQDIRVEIHCDAEQHSECSDKAHDANKEKEEDVILPTPVHNHIIDHPATQLDLGATYLDVKLIEDALLSNKKKTRSIKETEKLARIRRLRFRLITLYVVLLAINMSIISIYIVGQFFYTDLAEELIYLAASFGTMHVWFCLHLLEMFRSGLASQKNTPKKGLLKRNEKKKTRTTSKRTPERFAEGRTLSVQYHTSRITELSEVPAGPEENNLGISTNFKSTWTQESDIHSGILRKFFQKK